MGRLPRIQSSELHYHVIVRCNNEAFHFKNNDDFKLYLQTLRFYKNKHLFKLFNYELMNSHVHLFLQPSHKIPLEKTMHLINWNYARKYNKQWSRKGHFWLDRYKSIPVESDRYALALMRYMNRNPIRAGIVSQPGEWPWSGYRFYAFGETNDLLESHPTYLGLDEDEKVRRKIYMTFCNGMLPTEDTRKPELSERHYIGSDIFGQKLGLL